MERPSRRVAVAVGVLFLLGYVGVFLGSAVYSPVLDAPDYLAGIYPNRAQVIIGMLIELVNDIAVLGIGVLLFPVLRERSEMLAVAYLALRAIEAVVLVVSKFSVLALIPLSQEYLAAGVTGPSFYDGLGTLATAQRYWASKIQVVFFVLGALLLYLALYRYRLVPRFISVWGLFAVASLTVANLLAIPDPTEGFELGMLLFVPIFVSEILLAVWLIAKGFTPVTAVAPTERVVPAGL